MTADFRPEIDRHDALDRSARITVLGEAGRRTVWREWGRGAPVVLLHGGYGSWTHWTRNIAALSSWRRVLVPDTPGFGESDMPETISIAAVVASLWRNLDELVGPGNRLDLVGFSYGGVLSGEMAALRRDQVGRLILVTAGGLVTPGDDPELVRWRGLDPAERPQAHRANLQRLMFARAESADDLAVALQAANTERARLDSRKFRGAYDLTGLLAGKGFAVSGIWGDRDAARGGLPTALYEAALRTIDPEAEFIVMPGVGHWVQYEAADLFNATLRRLLAAPRRVPAARL